MVNAVCYPGYFIPSIIFVLAMQVPKDVAYENSAKLFVCKRQVEDVSSGHTRCALARPWVNIGAYIPETMGFQVEEFTVNPGTVGATNNQQRLATAISFFASLGVLGLAVYDLGNPDTDLG